MITLRRSADRGHANHGWLDARHHFSFANYHDPDRMGWGSIRVWNDDTIAAQSGFPPHPHRDMEIVTFVRSGAITHRDSLGNEGRTAQDCNTRIVICSAEASCLHGRQRTKSTWANRESCRLTIVT